MYHFQFITGQSTGIGSRIKIGTKNKVKMTANSSSCAQPTDNTTGLMYQEAECNSRNGLILKIALCDNGAAAYEVFVKTGSPPTIDSYGYKKVLSQKRDGYFLLMLNKNSFRMPAPGTRTKCIVGIRPLAGKNILLFYMPFFSYG